MQCVQFSGKLGLFINRSHLLIAFICYVIGVCLASWPANMRPVVFSIMDFEISEEITTFSKLTKVAAKCYHYLSIISMKRWYMGGGQ